MKFKKAEQMHAGNYSDGNCLLCVYVYVSVRMCFNLLQCENELY